MRTLRAEGRAVRGADLKASPFTDRVGSIADRAFVDACMEGVSAVLHSATLHKPHIVTHSARQFVETNLAGTLALLESAAEAGVGAFIFTSTTSAFGRALTPAPGEPAAWVTEDVVPVPKNIYGVTKAAAEDLCEIVNRKSGLPVLVLRTSRFFPEADDNPVVRDSYPLDNVQVNELLYRRVDIEDAVSAHLLALEHAAGIGFARYVISATTPFAPADLAELSRDAPAVVRRLFPGFEDLYARRGWAMFPRIDRVYVSARAREEIGWRPRHDFGTALARLAAGEDFRSELAAAVGAKGYHDRLFELGPYPVD